jgi:hypothetical protein
MLHVISLLESNVNDGRRDDLANTIKEFSFTNSDSQFGSKVNLVDWSWAFLFLLKNVFLKILKSSCRVVRSPFVVNFLLILFVKILDKLNILSGYSHEGNWVKLIRFLLELVNRSLDSAHEGSCPSNTSGFLRHVLRDWRVSFILLEDVSHNFQLFLISVEYLIVLFIKCFLDNFSSVNILEVRQQIKGTFRRGQRLTEGLFNKHLDTIITTNDRFIESSEALLPRGLVVLIEDVLVEVNQFLNLIVDLGSLFLDLLGVTCNFHKLWTKNGVELLLDSTSLLEIIKYIYHVNRSCKDFFHLRLELPAVNCLFLDFVTSAVELNLPVGEHALTLTNELESLMRVHFEEDLVDDYLFLDFCTDFC